jgi:putative endonuclease
VTKPRQLDDAIAEARPEPAAYVVGPADGSLLYKGCARNLAERLKDHRAGRVPRTKNHRPLALFHHEYCTDYTEARRRENFLKSGAGRAWLKQLLQP